MADDQPVEIFTPPNNLKTKVSSNGGLNTDVIKDADAAIEELKSEFAGWIIKDVDRLMEMRRAYDGRPGITA